MIYPETIINEMAEEHSFKKGNAHTLRTEPAWHYSIIDFKAGARAMFEIAKVEVDELKEKDNLLQEPLDLEPLIKALAEYRKGEG